MCSLRSRYLIRLQLNPNVRCTHAICASFTQGTTVKRSIFGASCLLTLLSSCFAASTGSAQQRAELVEVVRFGGDADGPASVASA